MNPGLSACKADALPLSYTPFCIQDAVKRAGLMNPKPRSFQRQAVPVTRSPVPSPILPRVGDRLEVYLFDGEVRGKPDESEFN